MRVQSQAPTGHVELVDAVVSQIAGAEVVPPVPGIMVPVLLERHPGSRPQPEIVVEPVRRRAGPLAADVAPLLDVPGLGHENVSDDALVQHLHRLDEPLAAAGLRPRAGGRGRNAVRPRPGGGPSRKLWGAGLLQVDVLAGVQRQDRRRGVPVVGGSQWSHRVDGRVVENSFAGRRRVGPRRPRRRPGRAGPRPDRTRRRSRC